MLLTAAAQGAVYLLDLGAPYLSTGNVTNLPNYTTYTLVDSAGNSGSVTAKLSNFTNGNSAGLNVASGDFPATILSDSFYVQGTKKGTLNFAGLQPNTAHTLTLIGSRSGNDGGLGRHGRYTLTSSVSTDVGSLDASDNTQTLVLYGTTGPTGTLILQLEIDPATQSNYAYLNGVKLETSGAGGSNTPPVATFSSSQVANTLAVNFTGAASTDSDGSIASYAWNFGDSSTGSGVSPSHTYATAGNYSVTLTVTDNQGATHALIKTVTVQSAGGGSNAFWLLDLGAPYLSTGNVTNLPDYATYTLVDSAGNSGSVTAKLSNFTNSNSGGLNLASGDFPATILRDSNYVQGTKKGTLNFAGLQPNTAYTLTLIASRSGNDGGLGRHGLYTLQSSISTDSGSLDASDNTQTLVLFGTAGPNGTLTLLVEIDPATSSRYAYLNGVKLETSGAGGSNTPPVAAFTSSQVANTLSVNFSGAASTDTDGSIASHAWNFGDGTTGSGVAPSHAYTAAGNYSVTLTVTDNEGATHALLQTVIAQPAGGGGGGGGGSTSGAYLQSSSANGNIVMEAEHYSHRTVAYDGYQWEAVSPTGTVGDGAMQIPKAAGASFPVSYAQNSARLDYAIEFAQTGVYYVWIRGLAINGGSDTVHVGLDNVAVSTGVAASYFTPYGAWVWSRKLMGGVRTRVNITTPGAHTLNLWMRESGMLVDRIVLTTSATYTPTGNGPEESSRAVTPPSTLRAFAADGALQANIRWTDYGVPHITGDSLEETGFGSGYAFARDNVCLLADQIIKYNSQRSRYFGPDQDSANDSLNLISDFSYLALGIREQAERNLANLSENTRALLSGYSKGYNLYLEETGLNNIDPQCAGTDWVNPLSETDILTLSLGVALLPGAGNFLAPIFRAAPPGEDFEPALARINNQPINQPISQPLNSQDVSLLASSENAVTRRLAARSAMTDAQFTLPDLNARGMASNGWALGSQKTENGKGMVLANPHFPHTGNLRFWQSHITIPGHLNVMGASLAGVPGVVNIGFNDNVAWTHTYSTAEHFVVYQLAMYSDDATGMTYLLDGQPSNITAREITIDVLVGPGTVATLTKKVYDSGIGPMLVVPGELPWTSSEAYAIRDANRQNFDIIDHWLAMNLAHNMTEFKQAFQNFDGVIFNNTMAADKEGNAFYIDDSTVPNLPAAAVQALQSDATIKATREYTGFTLLPASSGTLFNDSVPYEQAPKLDRTDFVQNSNDSFWLTNPASKITGRSPLYGEVGNEQSLRSRLAQKFLGTNDMASGGNGKFSLAELEATLLNNRTYLGEAVLTGLKDQCAAQGAVAVSGVSGLSGAEVKAGCDALAQWDGLMNTNSIGAMVFREFAEKFETLGNTVKWVNGFTATSPTSTPNTLSNSAAIMQAFAKGLKAIKAAGLSVNAPLGQVQFVERSTLNGQPGGTKLPWAGANNVEGGFNVYAAEEENDGTLLPRHVYSSMNSTQLSTKGYHVTYGSSWMYVLNFTDAGPVARGLLTYSQSENRQSPHYLDQTTYYSQTPQLRHTFPTPRPTFPPILRRVGIGKYPL